MMAKLFQVGLFIASLAARVLSRGTANPDAQPDPVAEVVHLRPEEPVDAPWQADHQLLCEGALPSRWRRVQYWVGGRQEHWENYNTPREFCAMHHYGGKEAFNRGAWWYTEFDMVSMGADIGSDMTRLSRPIPSSDDVFCSLRCKKPPYIAGSDDEARRQTDILIREAEDPAIGPRKYTVFNPEAFNADTREMQILGSKEAFPRDDLGADQFAFRVDRVGIPQQYYAENLRCRGPMPRSPLPPPFNNIVTDAEDAESHSPRRPFVSIMSLCAALWYGGDPRGNAGMTCRRGPGGTTIRKLETYLAHPALYRQNPLGGLYLDFWCHRACDCPDTQEDMGQPLPTFMHVNQILHEAASGNLLFRDSGNIIMETGRRTSEGQPERYRVPTYEQQQWATCTGEGIVEKCTPIEQIDPEILKGLMREPRDPFFPPVTEAVGKVRPQQCGKSCTSMQECKQAGSCSSCVAHPTRRLIHASGLSPFVPFAAAMCLSLSKSSSIVRLGGRSVEAIDEPPFILDGRISCLCNATYTSSSCCDARLNGIVHEEDSVGGEHLLELS